MWTLQCTVTKSVVFTLFLASIIYLDSMWVDSLNRPRVNLTYPEMNGLHKNVLVKD